MPASHSSSVVPAEMLPPPPPSVPTSTTLTGSSSSSSLLPDMPRITVSSELATTRRPTRKIFSEPDVAQWRDSTAYHLVQLMIARLSAAVEGKRVEDACHEGEATRILVNHLKDMTDWIDDIPLQTSPQRFGNKAFRDWIAKMEEKEEGLQKQLLKGDQVHAQAELSGQFRSSFGSGPRLDYGTGHELSFVAYLTILRLVGVFEARDEEAMVTRVFVAYLALVRKLQKVFRLEPAGSKGVWGLDDHQHLSYLWGASQLRTHASSRPAAILQPSSMSPLGVQNLFLSSILHIHDVKRGPFAEHSPVLHNIATTVPNWSKVATGLGRMYSDEVLHKLPVVQHFRFGPVLSWTRYYDHDDATNSSDLLPSTGDGMVNNPDESEDDHNVDHVDASRIRDEGTVAPWALPSLSGTTSPPLQPVRLSPTPTLSHSSYTSTPSGRLSPATFPTPSSSSSSPTTTTSFTPPEIFRPPRRRQSLLNHSTTANDDDDTPPPPSLTTTTRATPLHHHRPQQVDDDDESTTTVASQGGAAASSSPFGVLSSATLKQKSDKVGLPWQEVDQ